MYKKHRQHSDRVARYRGARHTLLLLPPTKRRALRF